MEMKGMMFAGGGLFLSMVATTVWMSGDVARMREEVRAKEAQKCALATQTDVATAQTASTTTPASDFTTPPAPQADDSCAKTDGAATNGAATTTGDGAAIDPVTGQPLPQGTDGFTTNDPSIDPATGQPVDSGFDPATGQPSDPAATSFDPATGQPIATGDPGMSAATTSTQPGGVAATGF